MTLQKWTNEILAQEYSNSHWLEERKFDLIPLIKNALLQLLNGYSLILVTDYEREWFERYLTYFFNKPNKNRPLIPFYGIRRIFPNIDMTSFDNEENINHLFDMLNISFNNNYFFWYVGKSGDSKIKIALRKERSFLWVFDEEFQNSFYMQSTDDMLDIKLLQLARIFDKAISASIFGEIRFE